jgi:acyl carrier protein
MQAVKSQVRKFIQENFIMGSEGTEFSDAESFLDRQILDSTGFLELITYLEETYAIKIEDEEMVPENLDSLDNISSFLSRKRGD